MNIAATHKVRPLRGARMPKNWRAYAMIWLMWVVRLAGKTERVCGYMAGVLLELDAEYALK
jgi:hypothetical protein